MNAPEPKGKEVDTHMFVDSGHAGNKVSCRSRCGFLICVNAASVQWFSMKHSTVETYILVLSLLQ